MRQHRSDIGWTRAAILAAETDIQRCQMAIATFTYPNAKVLAALAEEVNELLSRLSAKYFSAVHV